MTPISRNEEMSTYQNVDIEGLEAKSWNILNGDRIHLSSPIYNFPSTSAGHQKVGSNTMSPNNPHNNESETDKQYENEDENAKEPGPDKEVTTNCDESHKADA